MIYDRGWRSGVTRAQTSFSTIAGCVCFGNLEEVHNMIVKNKVHMIRRWSRHVHIVYVQSYDMMVDENPSMIGLTYVTERGHVPNSQI